VKTSAAAADVTNRGWEVTGSFVLTGETATERGVTPKRPFDPAQGQWGALQIIARRSRLTIDPVAFADSFAASTASRSATATGVCGIWYVNQYVKYVVSFERTLFDDDPNAKRHPENAVIFRLQFNLQPSF
jgi:phosphate-selective porin OprO/OprP